MRVPYYGHVICVVIEHILNIEHQLCATRFSSASRRLAVHVALSLSRRVVGRKGGVESDCGKLDL